MIFLNDKQVTDLGRIASHYYIKHDTIDNFNSMLFPHLSDSEALHVLCSSAEFSQLKIRPEEIPEIDTLKREVSVAFKGSSDDVSGKVSILLQSYLTDKHMKSFTLQMDTNYVVTNAGRIARALFEISLKRGWSTMTLHYLTLAKSIERKVGMYQQPLRQFDDLPGDVLRKLEESEVTIDQLLDMSPREVGDLIHNHKLSSRVINLAKRIPQLKVVATIQPITRGILRINIAISPYFEWYDKNHGIAELFWIWIEDGENEYIYHTESFSLSKKHRDETHELEFTIPVREPLPPQYYIRAVSDRWIGSQTTVTLSFQHLLLPDRMPPHTDLPDCHPVPLSALGDRRFESLFRFSHFNPVQSAVFHSLFHSDVNVLVGAPTGKQVTSWIYLFIL